MEISKYLHLGNDVVVKSDQIIGLFDLDTSTMKKSTREYLSFAERAGKVINVTLNLPKSFVITQNKNETRIYLSQLSTSTLLKRQREKEL